MKWLGVNTGTEWGWWAWRQGMHCMQLRGMLWRQGMYCSWERGSTAGILVHAAEEQWCGEWTVNAPPRVPCGVDPV